MTRAREATGVIAHLIAAIVVPYYGYFYLQIMALPVWLSILISFGIGLAFAGVGLRRLAAARSPGAETMRPRSSNGVTSFVAFAGSVAIYLSTLAGGAMLGLAALFLIVLSGAVSLCGAIAGLVGVFQKHEPRRWLAAIGLGLNLLVMALPWVGVLPKTINH